MSFSDHRGVQMDPSDLIPPPIVVWFADGTHAAMSTDELAMRTGCRTGDVEDALDSLITAGWLLPQEGGSFLASIPAEALA